MEELQQHLFPNDPDDDCTSEHQEQKQNFFLDFLLGGFCPSWRTNNRNSTTVENKNNPSLLQDVVEQVMEDDCVASDQSAIQDSRGLPQSQLEQIGDIQSSVIKPDKIDPTVFIEAASKASPELANEKINSEEIYPCSEEDKHDVICDQDDLEGDCQMQPTDSILTLQNKIREMEERHAAQLQYVENTFRAEYLKQLSLLQTQHQTDWMQNEQQSQKDLNEKTNFRQSEETERICNLEKERKQMVRKCYAEREQDLKQSVTDAIHAEYKNEILSLQMLLEQVETDKIMSLQREMKEMEQRYEKREATLPQMIVDTVRAEYQDEIAHLRRQLVQCETEKIQTLTDQIKQTEQVYKDRESNLRQVLTDEISSDYKKELSALRMELVHVESQHEEKVLALKEEHTSEINDLITRLDDFLAEQDQSLSDKERLIATLSSDIVEARAVASRLKQEMEIVEKQKQTIEKRLMCLQEIIAKRETTAVDFERRLQTMESNHKQSLEEEHRINKELREQMERYKHQLKESKSAEHAYKYQLEETKYELDKSLTNCSAAHTSLTQLAMENDDLRKVSNSPFHKTTSLCADSSDWLVSYPVIEKQS
eukprot:CAMPEP_0172430228 /NCGR_PEP_ID=MMETSP1064-20121228/53643_1 /TAXON_ID=202472 /ORGANISM="Aulacoseira subarctica , Strain CCAP 1002/5" /LENGTH=594 /DNA_ID=CAMNT_0013176149 /DNA_START=151 /DNA_END=1931 /DNA_ORIENTATION=+